MRFPLVYFSRRAADVYHPFRFRSLGSANLQVVGMEKTAHETYFVLSDYDLHLMWRDPSIGFLIHKIALVECIARAILALEKLTVKQVGLLCDGGDVECD